MCYLYVGMGTEQCLFVYVHVPTSLPKVPIPTAAALPVGSTMTRREAPGRGEVEKAAEESKTRLQQLSRPCWEGGQMMHSQH